MDIELKKLLFSNRGRIKTVYDILKSIKAGAVLAENSVETKDIKNNAVTTAKIAEQAVTTARLSDNAVTKSKINLEIVTVQISGTNTSGTADITDANSQILGVFQSAVSGGADAIPVKSVSIDSQTRKVEVQIGSAPGTEKSVTYTVVLLKS